MKSWLLNTNQFSILDRLKIIYFFCKNNRWTQDKFVKKFEQKMAEKVGTKYAVFVANGSVANTLLAQYVKDSTPNFKDKNIVVLPSTTWQTSCSPWIREGFTPKFIDVSMENFCLDTIALEEYVNKNHNKIACIFPTSLIGFSQDFDFYKKIADKFNIKICFDNCENTLGDFKDKNVSSYFTSTTSTYFGHQIQSVEGGFIFTNDEIEYDYFLMNRNHGMVRSLSVYSRSISKYKNNQVDSLFDFFSLGNNFRNSDIHAFIGLLDFKKFDKYKKDRKYLYKIFKDNLNLNKFYLPSDRVHQQDVAFCLPIILKNKDELKLAALKNLCKELNIEYRPIISGYLGYQTCYKQFFTEEKFYKNSIHLHKYGFYIGLHSAVSKKDILNFVNKINYL